ncbi:MAG: hypothetical protein JXL97_08300 [Bacteroidales bacterium]|nr:hypothetical protein [Bacteroidales bacterium]
MKLIISTILASFFLFSSPVNNVIKQDFENNKGQGCYLQLIGVECVSQEDYTGTDQIYIQVDGNTITNTFRISSGDYTNLTNLEPIYINGSVTITIWEYDWDPDDLLLKKVIDCSYKGAGEKWCSGTSDANYKLYYKVY